MSLMSTENIKCHHSDITYIGKTGKLMRGSMATNHRKTVSLNALVSSALT